MRLAYHKNRYCQAKSKNLSLCDFTVNTTLVVSFGDLDILYDNAA